MKMRSASLWVLLLLGASATVGCGGVAAVRGDYETKINALLGSPAGVLRAVGAAATRAGLPPPAALTGEWFGSRAVIAPTLSAQPCAESACWSANTPPGADFYAPSRYPEGAVGGGWFEIETDAVKVGQGYAFRMADGTDVPDPAARAQMTTVHGP